MRAPPAVSAIPESTVLALTVAVRSPRVDDMDLISIDDAATRLGTTAERIHALVADGTLLAVRQRDRVLILVDDVFAFGSRVVAPLSAITEDGSDGFS